FMRRVSNTDLALWVEDHDKSFGHRLISALQLNQPDANTRGMSPVLIAAVTRQAEEHAATVTFGKLADHSRLERATKLVMVAGSILGVMLLLWYPTIAALVARQFLADREIPRSVALVSDTRKVWPAGEDVTLRFVVNASHVSSDMQGEVRIDPDVPMFFAPSIVSLSALSSGTAPLCIASSLVAGKTHDQSPPPPSEYYPLVFDSMQSPHQAIFTARVRPTLSDYQYRAWLKDGRTRQAYPLKLVPRPAIVKQEAWVR